VVSQQICARDGLLGLKKFALASCNSHVQFILQLYHGFKSSKSVRLAYVWLISSCFDLISSHKILFILPTSRASRLVILVALGSQRRCSCLARPAFCKKKKLPRALEISHIDERPRPCVWQVGPPHRRRRQAISHPLPPSYIRLVGGLIRKNANLLP
jgi:hypothetical protein